MGCLLRREQWNRLRVLKLTLELMQAAGNRRQKTDYAAADNTARAE